MRPLGYVLYRGPSRLDGAPIIVVATGYGRSSHNVKTGTMIQTWILREDRSPLDAVKDGTDSSICGTCPHRGVAGKQRTCYVQVGQAPMQVWKSFHAGKYVEGIPDNAGRMVRLGSYGDPLAVPLEVWQAFTAGAKAWTGYTHAWRGAPIGYRSLLMASCDSPLDRELAKAAGWRTFRVALELFGQPAKLPGEAVCPASKEAGHKLLCSQCKACDGTASGRRGDIVIQAHGGYAVMGNLKHLNKRLKEVEA